MSVCLPAAGSSLALPGAGPRGGSAGGRRSRRSPLFPSADDGEAADDVRRLDGFVVGRRVGDVVTVPADWLVGAASTSRLEAVDCSVDFGGPSAGVGRLVVGGPSGVGPDLLARPVGLTDLRSGCSERSKNSGRPASSSSGCWEAPGCGRRVSSGAAKVSF